MKMMMMMMMMMMLMKMKMLSDREKPAQQNTEHAVLGFFFCMSLNSLSSYMICGADAAYLPTQCGVLRWGMVLPPIVLSLRKFGVLRYGTDLRNSGSEIG
eukprot:1888698-Rhodomonas_salina.1